MKKRQVKSEKGYQKVTFDEKAVKAGAELLNKLRGRKVPTSVALDPQTLIELKKEAAKRGIPYQVMMRSFILDGLRRFKKAV